MNEPIAGRIHQSNSSRQFLIAALWMLSAASNLFVHAAFAGDIAAGSTSGRLHVNVEHEPPVLAILPFVAGGNAGDNHLYISTFHDDLLTRLSTLQSLRVIARASMLGYRDAGKSNTEIGSELGADAILAGSVQSADDRIQARVQLFDARTGEGLWTRTYEGELSSADIFNMQAQIAVAVASAMNIALTQQGKAILTAIPTANTAAYAAYLRAMDLRSSLDLGQEYRDALEEAVALDPGFNRASAELVGILSLSIYFQADPETTERVEGILAGIHQSAPGSAEDLIAQAYYNYYVLTAYDRAHQLVTQARHAMPSDIRLVELESWIERRQGDFGAMVDTVRQGRILDPRNPRWVRSLNANLILDHRYEEALMEIEKSDFRDAELAYWYSVLLLQEHRDIGRWVDSVVTLPDEFPGVPWQEAMWDARITNRQYELALELLGAMEEQRGGGGLSGKDHMEIVTYWFVADDDRLAASLARVREILDRSRAADGEPGNRDAILTSALVAAAEGDTAEAAADVQRWWDAIGDDQAERAHSRDRACRVLGIAGATENAVQCIRAGLAEPSSVMPFLEPFLPYYDSTRDEPAFAELLADIAAGNDP